MQGIIRAADLRSMGASRTLLPYLMHRGVLRKVSRGAYMLSDYILVRSGFAEVAAIAPNSVFCLLSALQYHEITTQMPNEMWIAVERGKHIPVVRDIPVKVIQLSKAMFSAGIEEYKSDGVIIRVYSPAKTIVDCFRFRNKIGLDVAREALIDCIAQKKATRDEIWRYAHFCRIATVIRPYLEMA